MTAGLWRWLTSAELVVVCGIVQRVPLRPPGAPEYCTRGCTWLSTSGQPEGLIGFLPMSDPARRAPPPQVWFEPGEPPTPLPESETGTKPLVITQARVMGTQDVVCPEVTLTMITTGG